MWGHQMAKKIILTICAVFQFALCVDFFTAKRVDTYHEGQLVLRRYESGLGILEKNSDWGMNFDFVIFSVANVVFGFVLVWIWKKFDGKKAQGGGDAG
jgi:NADH:ubiquinone oxidoreductase subunit 3 (subunit A)